MFQIAKNPTKNRALLSIALNDAEIEEMNELLVQAQELTGTLHTSIKDSYKQLLTTVISQCKQMIDTVKTNVSTVKTDAENETDVVSTVKTTVDTVKTADDTVKTEDFENALWERTKELTDDITVKTQEIESLKLDSTVKTNEIEALKAQLAVYEDMDIPETIEVDKPFTPGENDIFIQLDEKKAAIMHAIAEFRGRRKQLPTPPSISQVAEEMIFNKGTLYNWHGEYPTGFKG